MEGIPKGVVGSRKNCVLEDSEGRAVFVLYKLGDGLCACHSIRMIAPFIAFAVAVTVVDRR
jgi:hypothetical protein